MGKRILIVDDEFFITRSLSFMFKREGYECQVTHDGQAAIEQIGRDRPDLIFLDVDMPVKDGYEVAREIRRHPAWQAIYIVMLSAKGQEIDQQRGLQAGANEYTLKPFDPREVLEKARAILGE